VLPPEILLKDGGCLIGAHIADAHRDDGKRFIVHADEKLTAFVELERQVLTVTFYLASIHADS
jgi:hypothetical protein